MHTVFYIAVIVYFTMGFAAINYSLVRKNHVSRRIILYLYVPEAVAFVSYFGVKIVPLDVELTPLAYVFSQIMYLFMYCFIYAFITLKIRLPTSSPKGAEQALYHLILRSIILGVT